MRRVILMALIVIIVLVSLVLGFSTVSAAGEGTIEGAVVNASADSVPVPDITVTLYPYQDSEGLEPINTSTDGEGKFSFSGLATEPAYQYSVGVTYQEAEYYSDVFQFEAGQLQQSIEMKVYNATTNGEAIKAHAWSIAVSVQQDSLLVMENVILTNSGSETYIGTTGDTGKEVLRFLLPEGAQEIQFVYGFPPCCSRIEGRSIISGRALPPGMKELGFSYTLPYSAPSYLLSRPVDYPTDIFVLYVQEVGGLKLESEQLTPSDPVSAENGTRFLQSTGKSLAAGSTLAVKFSVSDSPEPSASSPKSASRDYQSAFKWVGVALAIVGAGFCVGYPVVRRRSRRLGAVPSETPSESPTERRRILIEIARLDDDFEAGKLSEEEYQRLRAEKKAQLAAINESWRKDDQGS